MRRTLPLLLLFVLAGHRWADAADLRLVSTQHYRIHTDLNLDFAQDVGRRMDAMYEEYARRLAVFGNGAAPQVFNVYLFSSKADYLRLVGSDMQNSGGIFIPEKKAVAAFLEERGRDPLRKVLQHEAFHQFAHGVLNDSLPVWLNEGMAEFFEEGIWTGHSFLLGQVPPSRLDSLRDEMQNKQLVRFRKMLSMSHAQWNATLAQDRTAAGAQYNQAWAMVHLLICGSDGGGQLLYRGRLVKLLQLLHDGREPTTAFNEAFSNNIDGFQQRFVEYARQLAPTREAALLDQQQSLSELLARVKEGGNQLRTSQELQRALKYIREQMGMPADDRLSLEPNPGAPLPDLLRQSGSVQVRTRFYESRGRVEHETLLVGR